MFAWQVLHNCEAANKKKKQHTKRYIMRNKPLNIHVLLKMLWKDKEGPEISKPKVITKTYLMQSIS